MIVVQSPAEERELPPLQEIKTQCEQMAKVASEALASGGILILPGQIHATIFNTRKRMVVGPTPSLIAEYLQGLAKLWRRRKCTQAERDALAKATAAAGKGDGS